MRKPTSNLKIKVVGIMAILIILSCTPALTSDISNTHSTQELTSFCFGSNDWTFS